MELAEQQAAEKPVQEAAVVALPEHQECHLQVQMDLQEELDQQLAHQTNCLVGGVIQKSADQTNCLVPV